MMNDLRIITTGGTFDKLYDAIKGELTFRESQLPRILQQARLTLSVCLEGPLAVDSLYMSEEERNDIVKYMENSEEERIVVIHGTDTMVETATLAASGGRLGGKIVVFTGAMVPYSLENSDAEFNLGFAIAAVQLLPEGVYIAMGGRVYNWNEVKKNREKGLFERL